MSPLDSPQILVVDDNPGDQVLIEEMITEAFQGKAEIRTAGTLHEVVERDNELAFPLILLDLALPDSWGADTYRGIRAWAPSSIIVVLSGNTDETTALQLVAEGAQDYLVKGHFSAQDLRRVIQYGWERARIDRELSEQKAWWEALIRAIPDGIVISDRAGAIRFANPAARKLLRVADGEALERPILELHPLEVRDLVAADLEVLNSKPSSSGSRLRQLPVVAATGDEVPCDVVRTQFVVGQETLTVNLFRDVRERRELERQLLQTQKMEAAGQLTAGVAHDFNNLLGIAMGNLELLGGSADPKMERRIGTAMRALERGAELTKRLLLFSRSQGLNPHKMSLPEAVSGFVGLATRTIGPNIRVETVFAESLPAIYVDQGELENVLLNLTVNAKDAMPEGGLLLFEACKVQMGEELARVIPDLPSGEFVLLTVTDTGTGMPREVVERAFEPFFTTKGIGKGTGLGLSMVYGFMKQSGGAVKIYSEPGVGTSFRLYFPVVDTTGDRSDPAIPRERVVVRPGTRALLVDDEADLREVAHTFLTNAGIEVVTAEDGDQGAAKFVQDGPFDLLVTDVLMPGTLNGLQLAVLARKQEPNIKVIFTSGFPARALEDRQLVPDSIFLSKPYTSGAIEDALQRLG